MIETIFSHDRDRLDAKLRQISERSVAFDADLIKEVSAIIADVRRRGDAALMDYSARFDDCVPGSFDLRIGEEQLKELAAGVDPLVQSALQEAISNVRRFHEREKEESWRISLGNHSFVGQRIMPIDSAGLYVPGGSASYPSSVVMNVVPAQVAGVERIAVVTPPRTLHQNPSVAAALTMLGVSEVYAVGGAQAIAALAFGTETIPAVDKITGPGNRYVAAAKRLVFGTVGIDAIAGPSEVAVLADDSASARFVAADLLAQAEHDEDASALLITTSRRLADEVADELIRQSQDLPRREIIERSLAGNGALIVVPTISEAVRLVNQLAPEHLEIIAAQENEIAAAIRNAGAIFFGQYSPEPVGDYFAGPNHVLPTARTARFASSLGVHDFIKRTNIVRFSPEETIRTAPMISTLARAEGLEAHARAVLMRCDTW